VALLPMRLVSDEIADGTLVNVIPDVDVPDRPLYALHSPGTQTTARVRLFLDFVSEWFRKQAPAQPVPGQQTQPTRLAAVKSALPSLNTGTTQLSRRHRVVREVVHPDEYCN
jgi:hypothetical protein